MASKRTRLQSVLEQHAQGTPPPVVSSPATQPDTTYKQPGRIGKINITGYFQPAVKSSFRMIQTQYPEKTIQDLLGEALNDLFAKYNVPQTARLPDTSA